MRWDWRYDYREPVVDGAIVYRERTQGNARGLIRELGELCFNKIGRTAYDDH
jgi:hypothetical protein